MFLKSFFPFFIYVCAHACFVDVWKHLCVCAHAHVYTYGGLRLMLAIPQSLFYTLHWGRPLNQTQSSLMWPVLAAFPVPAFQSWNYRVRISHHAHSIPMWVSRDPDSSTHTCEAGANWLGYILQPHLCRFSPNSLTTEKLLETAALDGGEEQSACSFTCIPTKGTQGALRCVRTALLLERKKNPVLCQQQDQ